MSGLGIRFYSEEDVDPELAVQFPRLGHDAFSCHAAGNPNQGLDDEWQLHGECAANDPAGVCEALSAPFLNGGTSSADG